MDFQKKVATARVLLATGILVGTAVMGWRIARDDGPTAVLNYLGVGSAVFIVVSAAWLLARKQFNEIVESDGTGLLAITAVGLMISVGARTDPGSASTLPDRVLQWAFVVFAVGLSELFLLFVVASILGKIKLANAFSESSDGTRPPPDPKQPPTMVVSLARLQAFAWTLVVMITYFHRVTTNKTGELPGIPAELLMVMGISGAIYLTSKEMVSRTEIEKARANTNANANANANATKEGEQ